ncbi:hypothetical protein FJ945_29820 [Mesorhizobium sp. B2-4-9]|uniref:hypothetical protein n=1 Tax=Mesorhizobium sp. B2-4-9 TaxID=2589940 RepID=UPI00112782CE|nr:hypothetical protein [Mesorhizobium sp. B2-4-9]TPL14817.1 hypothetical protein FJ945_29820 [Mesorhizobium sp. B2-4-9]
MDAIVWIALLLACLLSYQMPIYIARLTGYEAELASLWATGWGDNLAGRVVFVAVYMVAGLASWLLPVLLIYVLIHPRYGASWRPRVAAIVSFPFLPFKPWYHRLYQDIEARAEQTERKRGLKQLYKKEFSDQFPSFANFEHFYNWSETNGLIDPRHRFSIQQDAFEDSILLLSLPERFTDRDLSERYRKLMKCVHPDQIGPNDIARRLNIARDLIAARKGWK